MGAWNGFVWLMVVGCFKRINETLVSKYASKLLTS
jgi:hypothetical protein